MKKSCQLSVVSCQRSEVRTPESGVQSRYKTLVSTGYWLLATGSFLLLSACGPQMKVRFAPQPSPEELAQEVARVSQTAVPRSAPVPVSAGSLWPADDRTFFYGDRKALRVGDSLTVRVVEAAKASNTADTDLSRASANKAKVTALFGLQGALARSDLTNLLDVTADSSHKGSGATKREGKLTASLTALVKEVLPNGNLVIQGSRSVVVNYEEQFTTLTGIVRPEDIGRDNVVLSSQIADARITFGGVGLVADKQRSGWGTWIFDWIFPF
ncbi:MAG: flagellar basal body L-ring protein FlgH [Deltaproteobacteria bacterium]|nr:flagellar basal body L-ring protein FlgH [Deltaproteobacteria bacterium]